MTLPFGTDLAAGTLRTLARRQGTRRRPGHRGAARQDPPRGARRRPSARRRPAPCPPLYYGTVDATPLWIGLLHEAWRWGLAEPRCCASCCRHLEAALGWIGEHADADGDGLPPVRRHHRHRAGQPGLEGLRRRHALARRHASPRAPIALVETQAYAVAAADRRGRAARGVFGEPGEELRDWARALADRVRDDSGSATTTAPTWRWRSTATATPSTAWAATWAMSSAPARSDEESRPGRRPAVRPEPARRRSGSAPWAAQRRRTTRSATTRAPSGPMTRRSRLSAWSATATRPPGGTAAGAWSPRRPTSTTGCPELFGGTAESADPRRPTPRRAGRRRGPPPQPARSMTACLGLRADAPRGRLGIRAAAALRRSAT